MPDPLSQRVKRVCAAMADSTSYKMLWSSMVDGLVPPDRVTLSEPPGGNELHPDTYACESDGIPPVIFQTWKTRSGLPLNFAYWRATFVKHHPAYRLILWDDTENRHLIASGFSWFLEIYDRYPNEIFRSDAIRLFFLYSFGGIYADLDVECIRPLDDLLRVGDVLIGRMGNDATFEHSISNAVMASKPKQIFWLLAIAMAIERFMAGDQTGRLNETCPEQLTGPILLKAAVDYYVSHSPDEIARRAAPVLDYFDASEYHFGRLVVLPSHIWHPLNWNNPAHQVFRRKMSRRGVLNEATVRRRFGSSYLIHYCAHSWDEMIEMPARARVVE